MFKFFRIMLAITAAVLFVAPAFAQDATPPAIAKLTLGENLNIELHYLLQVQGNMAETWGAGTADDKEREYYSKDIQVRRSRIILKGQVAENLTFFMETDDIKIGSQGKGASNATEGKVNATDKYYDKQGVYTQDAFLSYKVNDSLNIAAGQILLPFMHSNRTSGAQIFGVDYNSAIIPLSTTTNTWRDTGVEFRGLLMNGLIDYRAGIFQGVQPSFDATDRSKDINPNDSLRYCGRVQINLKDAESEFFYSENYLGKKDIISFGVGIDRQASLIRDEDGELGDYMAWTADVTVDTKISDDMICTIHGAYVNVKNQPGKVEKQNGYFIEAGLLMGKIQPLVKYATWVEKEANTANGDDIEKTSLTAGVNYFLKGHNANIKGEVVLPMSDDLKDTKGSKQVNVQAQIFI